MSDTETTTAPDTGRLTMDQAIARFAGSTAQTATREPSSGPETSVTAAAGVESETPTDLNTAQATQDAETPGEAQTEEAKPALAPDSVAFIADDGTPVTVEEARKGYLRQSEFTRKTQTLAEQQRVFAERESMIAQARDVYVQQLQEVEQLLASRVPPEPDPALRQHDPIAYMLAKDARNEALVQLATAHQNRQVAEAQRAHEQGQKAREFQQAQLAMLEQAIPAWKDPNVKAKETAAIRSYATALGFTPEEIERPLSGQADHRLVSLLRDAVVGSQVRAGGAKGGVKPAVPGMPQPTRAEVRAAQPASGQERDLRAAREQLGSDSRHNRFAAAVSILAGNQRRSA